MPDWLSPGHALRRTGRRGRGFASVVIALIAFAAAAVIAAWLDPLPPRFTGAARASDGDSLWVGTDRVRLLGLDAPELDQVCWRPNGDEWPCGRAARDRLAALLHDGNIDCAPQGEDRFGRTLAHCAVGEVDLGAAIVSDGLAVARDDYAAEQRAARDANLGIWNGRFTDPRTWRDQGPADDPGPGIVEQVWTWLRELTGARTLR